MKIYTKKGDTGTTSLIGGARVKKHHLRIDSYGSVDELNSFIGIIVSDAQVTVRTKEVLKEIQDRLFTMGASLASDPTRSKMQIPDLLESDVEFLEQEIDLMNETLPALKHFVLPGGNPLIAHCHVARCVCRRAERLVVALAEEEEVLDLILMYLNRLSDYLFVLARKLTHDTNTEEVYWKPRM